MKRFIILLIVIMTITFTANAQEEVEYAPSLLDRVVKLETKSSILDRVNISGFIQAAYNWEDNGVSTFNLRRARLSIAGDAYRGANGATVDWRLQTEFTGSPKVVDLWIRYRPHKAFGIQLGEFKTPMMIELTEYSQPKLEFIDFSLAVQRLQRMGSNDITGISSIGRDIGVQFYGDLVSAKDFNIISYNVAVMNGNGINVKDNNKSKDVIGRLMVRPTKKLTLAGFYMYGEGGFSQSALLEKFGCVERNPSYVKLYRFGGGIRYTGKSITARAEYIRAKTGNLYSESAYASASYNFNTKLSIAARWDYFDENVYTRANECNYTIGVNYKPLPLLRLQLNYILKKYENMDLNNDNVVGCMITMQF